MMGGWAMALLLGLIGLFTDRPRKMAAIALLIAGGMVVVPAVAYSVTACL